MKHPFACRCGAVHGHVDTEFAADRARCYCRDCQAFAHFLGAADQVLDAEGGTEIVALLPRGVHFAAGADRLACMSLSERGLLRWYAGCCRTPLGNTLRDPKMSYLGMVYTSLRGPPAELDAAFGPVKIALNTKSARGPVDATPLATFVGVLRIMRSVLGARLSKAYRQTRSSATVRRRRWRRRRS